MVDPREGTSGESLAPPASPKAPLMPSLTVEVIHRGPSGNKGHSQPLRYSSVASPRTRKAKECEDHPD